MLIYTYQRKGEKIMDLEEMLEILLAISDEDEEILIEDYEDFFIIELH